MEELLKKQQKKRFSGAGASQQNGAAERAINTVVDMPSAILIQAWMICHKYTLSIDFGLRKWTMLYGSKVGSLIYSMVYKPLGKFYTSMFLDPRFKKPVVKTLNTVVNMESAILIHLSGTKIGRASYQRDG